MGKALGTMRLKGMLVTKIKVESEPFEKMTVLICGNIFSGQRCLEFCFDMGGMFFIDLYPNAIDYGGSL
jgi:hypothetical protein